MSAETVIADMTEEIRGIIIERPHLPDLAGAFARGLVRYYSLPENQAFFAGAMAGAVLSHRLRPVPGLIFTAVAGLTAQRAYLIAAGMRSDLAAIADAARGGDA